MTDITAKIAEARRLDAAATTGPWTSDNDIHVYAGVGKKSMWLATCPTNMVASTGCRHPDSEIRDAALIAHARNHHAALWDAIEAMSQLVAEALAASRMQVRGYGMQGKLAYLKKAADDGAAALARLAEVKP